MAVVIIPTYQPNQILQVIVDQLWAYGCQVIVVDDGSGEEYRKVFDRVKDTAVVLTHPVNRGKGAAIKTALHYIKEEMKDCDVIGTMDADGQHLTQDLVKLSEVSEMHKNALVLGVRDVGERMPLKSRLGNQITRMFFLLASGVKVSDTQTGLRVFGADLASELLKVEGSRYEYEMNVLMAFARKGIPMIEVPIHTVYHDEKNSCSHFRIFWDSLRIYRDILKFTLSSFSSFFLDYLLFTLFLRCFSHMKGYPLGISGFVFFLPGREGGILLANIAARVISACYNYAVNCRFVFHERCKSSTAAGYFALAGVLLAMNSVVLKMFMQAFHFPAYLAKLLTELLLFFISWLVQKCLLFRKGRGVRFLERKAGL